VCHAFCIGCVSSDVRVRMRVLRCSWIAQVDRSQRRRMLSGSLVDSIFRLLQSHLSTMSAPSSSVGPRETRHAMKLRHKSELKTLMSAAAKGIGAKKKQKEDAAALELVHAEQMKDLERKELEDKEREEGGGDGGAAEDKPQEDGESNDAPSSSLASPPAASSAGGAKVPSRAQKKKAAALAKDAARSAELREQTKDMVDLRGVEDASIAQHLAGKTERKMRVREMVSDGHCLYRAVADQVQRHHLTAELPLNDNAHPFLALRQLAAQYIDAHRSEFEAFMLLEDAAGNPIELNDVAWKKYLRDLVSEDLAVWGGHNEVVALSKVLRRPIVIWSADGKMEVGEEFRVDQTAATAAAASPASSASSPSPSPDTHPLHISFHQHYYGLGAHYNSVIADEEADAAEEFATGSSDAAASTSMQ
jgi:OTU domain-containing protein 6